MKSNRGADNIPSDTIDLQDHKQPSAKDHTRQPSHPSAIGAGPAAPHQAETLREVAAEAEEEQVRSPRVSGDWNHGESTGYRNGEAGSAGNSHQQQASSEAAEDGHYADSTVEEFDLGDNEGDDMDDDMMDKISSSPSIDDGGYSLPIARSWPIRVESRTLATTPKLPSPSRGSSERSSSPFMDAPVHFALPFAQLVDPEKRDAGMDHHLLPNQGEYAGDPDDSVIDELGEMLEQLEHFIPSTPDLVANNNDDSFYAEDHTLSEPEEMVHKDCDEVIDIFENAAYNEDEMMIPYVSSDEEDDDTVPFPTDPRFIDSGWGGECLQDIEDIDFEFVYALHTFVATVEGQANATKGDTMVLLDDSNSYWWLVRVVKDSSIGKCN